MSPIEAERGVRPRGVMDFDPSLLHEVNGETLTNPTATAGKHQAAVKAHLDDLIVSGRTWKRIGIQCKTK